MQSVQQELFPIFQQFSVQSSLRMFSLNYFIIISNFCLTSWKVWQKMKFIGFASCWPCNPQAGSRSQKWYKIVEVNGAYKHRRYEQIRLSSFLVIFNIKVFARKTNTNHYNQKLIKRFSFPVSLWPCSSNKVSESSIKTMAEVPVMKYLDAKFAYYVWHLSFCHARGFDKHTEEQATVNKSMWYSYGTQKKEYELSHISMGNNSLIWE